MCPDHISLKMIRLLSSFASAGGFPVVLWGFALETCLRYPVGCRVGWVLPSEVMGSTGIRLHILLKCFAIEEALDPSAGCVMSGTNQAQPDHEHLSSSPQSTYIYLKSAFTCASSSWSCFAGKGPTSQTENLRSTIYLHVAWCMGTKTDIWLRSLLREKKKKKQTPARERHK